MDRPVVSAGLKLARATAADCPCLLVQRVAKLRGHASTTDFVYYSLSSPAFVRHILVGGQTGTQLPHISGSRIASFALALPPVAEQRRIVEALDSYLTRLDAATEGLKRVEANLKRYRASVLKAAVEGRLVPTEAELAKKEGRDYEPASVLLTRVLQQHRREAFVPDTANLPALPEGWCWATLDQLAVVQSGIQKGKKRDDNVRLREVPYLRVANVQRGYLDLDEVKTIAATEDEIAALRLQRGDVLFNEGGDRDKLGRGWVWNDEIPECIHQNHVFRARLLTDALLPRFLSWYANSNGQKYFFDEGKQTTNLASLNSSKLRRLPIPIPPKVEQLSIASELDRLLSDADASSKIVGAALRRIARLRQSILKWAFEGKLVDQNPNDEPASVLLERIRQKRAATASVPKRGKKKVS